MRIPHDRYRSTGGRWSTAALIVAVCCGAACASSNDAEEARSPVDPRERAPVVAGNDTPTAVAEVEEARLGEEHWERVPVAAARNDTPAVSAAAEELRFGPGKATLTPDTRASLDRLAARLRADSADCQVDLRPAASAASDPLLARKRAAAVRRYLSRQQGIPEDRISEDAVSAAAGSAPRCVLVANLG